MRLQSALDQEVHVAIQRLYGDGAVDADIDNIYRAIQRSNSSLGRRQKKQLQGSIERVLSFLQSEQRDWQDSEEELEKKQLHHTTAPDLMNRSLRTNLMPMVVDSTPGLPMAPRSAKISHVPDREVNGEPISKRRNISKALILPHMELSLDDVGGMDQVIERLEELLLVPLMEPEMYKHLRAPLPRGILLHGPPGCGKTMISRAFAAEMELPFIEILGPSVVSSMSGDSEKAIREKFEEARKNAPCLLFIDELDAIAPKRDSSQSQMEKRIVAQLLVSMDELGKDYEKPVIVLAATNRPDSLDPALRRGGRFDTEITINVPNEQVREQILKAQTRETPLSEDFDFQTLARRTAGFVGADLHDLVGKAVSWKMDGYRKALKRQALELHPEDQMEVDGKEERSRSSKSVISLRRLKKRLSMKDATKPRGFENTQISLDDFLAVLPGITPSSKREGFATIPDVTWEDIGALQSVREKLQSTIIEPIKHPELYEAFGIKGRNGVLLWGPPGCGKTLLAKAAAAESKANFIAVKGPELVDKFVGESEAAVRKIFSRARSSAPVVIFFDEIDALVPRREGDGGNFAARIVGTLLTELDGLDERAGIYVIGATNRPDMIDDALLRPGRLGMPLFVGPPGAEERAAILNTLLRGKPINDIADILQIARACEGYSGADLNSLLEGAVHCAIARKSSTAGLRDFLAARDDVAGSLTDMRRYDELKRKFGGK